MGFFIKLQYSKYKLTMKSLCPLFFVLFVSLTAFSQETKDTLTIVENFDKIYRISTSYQEYKVISKAKFQSLKQKVSDSLKSLAKEVKTRDLLITSQKDSIEDLKKVAAVFESDWRQTVTQKNNIQIFGVELQKSTYNITVWSFITVLIILLIYFTIKFKTGHIITTKAKYDLQELEEEFAVHKKKSLNKEQKLRRELQDEINKQRGI